MYITPYQKKQLRTVLIFLIGIPLTVFAGYKAVQWFTSAGGDTQPHNIIIGNLAQSSVTVTWTTEDKVSGSAILVENGTEKTTAIDRRGSKRRNTHYVEFENLEPGTSYKFKIISGSDTYQGDEGENFSFTTPNVLAEQPTPIAASGEVEGNWGDDVLIYIGLKDKSTYPAITILNDSGSWIVDLSVMRKVTDKTLYKVSSTSSLVILGVSEVDNGGVVEGEYGEMFNSDSVLVESLNPTGMEYESYISTQARLLAQEEPEEPSTEEPYIPPVVEDEPIEEEEIEREYELRTDIVWVNLVSADGGISDTPQSYGEDTVTITNLTDTTFTVIWYSQEKEIGHIMYGLTASDLSEKGRDERDGIASQGQYYVHSIEATQLQPETQYYFEVYSGEEEYPTTFDLTTYPTEDSPPEFETLSGTVNAQYPESVVVTAKFKDNDGVGSTGESNTISTLPDSEGNWILTTGSVRDESGGYFNKSASDLAILKPLYLSDTAEVESTYGEATSEGVELSVEGSSGGGFVKIPLLDEYGILSD
mgnify:CR=1 FL=1